MNKLHSVMPLEDSSQGQASDDVFIFPASFAQQRLWFLDKLEPGQSAYNVPFAIRLRGDLNIPVLERSLQELIARHEVLRTTFSEDQTGKPVQVVAPQQEFCLPVADLSALSVVAQEYEARQRVIEHARQPFDLKNGPLFRAKVIRLSHGDHVLSLTLHHAIVDGWSWSILLKELSALYEAFAEDRPSPLPDLSLQYGDYASWQHDWLQGEHLEVLLDYWKRQLEDALYVLELPTDLVRPPVQTFVGSQESILLPRALEDALVELSQKEGVTLFMTLLAAFNVLLGRYSGQEDILVGSPISGRTRSELEGLIGFFVNTLTLRTDLSNNPSFRELLQRVRETTLDAYAHQDLPFERLVEELSPERDLSRSPLVQVMFIFENAPEKERQRMANLEIGPFHGAEGMTAKFDLLLNALVKRQGLRVGLTYNVDLFERATAQRMLSHLCKLLEDIVADPNRRIADFPLLGESERQHLLVDLNRTSTSYPRDVCVHQLVEEHAERTPDALAVVCGEQRLSYHSLNESSNQLAHYLRAQGVGPGSLVAICMERSTEMVTAVLATLKAGAGYLPLDPDYPGDRLEFMLQDSRAALLLTQEQLIPRFANPSIKLVCVDRDQPRISAESRRNPVGLARPQDWVYVIYTSGSTGRPKGVCLPHRALTNLLFWQREHSPARLGSRTLQFTSLSFDVSFQEIFSTWSSGGTLVLISESLRRDPVALLAVLREQEIERLFLTFVALQQLAEAAEEEEALPDKLQEIITAGEQLQITPQIASLFRRMPHCTLTNQYGPSETHVVTAFALTGSPDTWNLLPAIGKPISNTQVYILDSFLHPVPPGASGELYIGGIALADGYLHRPELTAERFVPNPFASEPGARLYKTGDLCRYLLDGNIQYLGRIDNQVKIRGYRVELGEIESELAKYPSVQSAVAVVREDVPGDKRLVAYLVSPNQDLSPAELRLHLKRTLPDYMVPAAFVRMAAFPLTPSGKINRRALPAPDENGAEASPAAYRTPTEELVAGIWMEVLRCKNLGVGENFFDLGGHSLLATQVISRIRRTLRVDLPLRAIFEHPTVAELADLMDGTVSKPTFEPPTLCRQARATDSDGEAKAVFPLSFAEQRLWTLHRLQPNASAYNLSIGLRLKGELQPEPLRRALEEIVKRHEILRVRFRAGEGEPKQWIRGYEPVLLPLVDLKDKPDPEAEARRIVQEASRRPFDLAEDPMLRAILLKLADRDHILLVTVHHIVFDGWSRGIFLRELSTLYVAYAEGKPSPLPELTIQYPDYSVWQRQYLRGETLDRQVGYWKRQLAGAPPSLDLPTDHARPPIENFRGAQLAVAIPTAIADPLKDLSRRAGVTFFMTLLGAFNVLLARYSGQDDIVVGTPIAGRLRTELERLIGFFVNTLPLRTDLSGNPTFLELLARIRETTLGAYAHQDLPFEKIVEEIKPERDLSRNPVFQVMFALQNMPEEMADISGLELVPFRAGQAITTKFDLSVFLLERPEGLLTTFEYNTDLFDASTIARMAQHFQILLEAIAADANRAIDEFPLLSQSERHQLVVEFNATESAYEASLCVHQLFERQAVRTPDAVAAVCGDEKISYAELNRRANRLARGLVTAGAGADALVGIYLERSIAMCVAVLGTLKAGAAYVPLDPAYPKDRIAFIVEDARIALLITEQSLAQKLPPHAARVLCLDQELPAVALGDDFATTVKPENRAYVIYTSGSTGKPKGVQIEHRSVVNFLGSMRREPGLEAHDVLLAVTTLSFDIAGLELYLPLAVGAQVVIASREQASDGHQLLRLMEQSDATVMQATPATWRLLLDSGWGGKANLKILCGGEALARELAEKLVPRCRELWNMYGPTETTIWSSLYRVGDTPWSLAPLGRPIANTQMYVVDKHGALAPVGVPGELYIGGDGVARGYWNRAELTAEKFIPDTYRQQAGARLYKTGDRVRYLPDGNLQYLGRIDNQVKLRGFRIELGEIESVLAQHEGVEQTAVVLREDQPGNQQLVAYLIADPNYRGTSTLPESRSAEQIEQWQQAWDNTYRQADPASKGTFNIAGWNSSYTGLPIPAEQMREWVDRTAHRILAFKPRRILEIGCGTGLLLFRLAPHVEHYHGSDFSESALDSIRQQLAKKENQALPVALSLAAADNLGSVDGAGFDTIVLNSVVQYFPSAEYLFEVFERAWEKLQPGGRIFVGDVRSLPLLEVFHSDIELSRAPSSLAVKEILRRAERRAMQEEELVIDPAFFAALKDRLPGVGAVDILVKRGRAHNEVTKFRYDVTVQARTVEPTRMDCVWLDWQEEALTLPQLRTLLEQSQPDVIGLHSLPNARIWHAVQAWQGLKSGEGADTVGQLHNRLQESRPEVVEPEDLWQLAAELSYEAEVRWGQEAADGTLEVVFRRPGSPQAVPRQSWKTGATAYVNDPVKNTSLRELVPEVRLWLAERLPSYMVPSAFVVLKSFPLTPNGKVDRRALPAPDLHQSAEIVPARNATEELLVEIWQKLLGIDRLGVNENFFDLGGHSLLATQLVSRIRRTFAVELPLREVFEHPTIAELGERIKAAPGPEQQPRLVAASRASFRQSRSSL